MKKINNERADSEGLTELVKSRVAIHRGVRSEKFCSLLEEALLALCREKLASASPKQPSVSVQMRMQPLFAVKHFEEVIQLVDARQLPVFFGQYLAELDKASEGHSMHVPSELLSQAKTHIDMRARKIFVERSDEKSSEEECLQAKALGVSQEEYQAQRALLAEVESRKKANALLSAHSLSIKAVLKSSLFNEFACLNIELGVWQKRIARNIESSSVKKPTDAILKLMLKELGEKSPLKLVVKFILRSIGMKNTPHLPVSAVSVSKLMWVLLLSKDLERQLKQAADILTEHATHGADLMGGKLTELVEYYFFKRIKTPPGISSREEKKSKESPGPESSFQVNEGEDETEQVEQEAGTVLVPGEAKRKEKELQDEAVAFGFSSVEEFMRAKEEDEILSQLVSVFHPEKKIAAPTSAVQQDDLLSQLERLSLPENGKTPVQASTSLGSLSASYSGPSSIGHLMQRPSTPTGEHPNNQTAARVPLAPLNLSHLSARGQPSFVGVFAPTARNGYRSPGTALRVIQEGSESEGMMELTAAAQTPRQAATASPEAGPVGDQGDLFPSRRLG